MPRRNYDLPERSDPAFDAAAARALLEAARVNETQLAERATGYYWGEPALRSYVETILAEAEGAGDDRLIFSDVSYQTTFTGGTGFDTLVVTGSTQPNNISGFEAIEFQNGATLTLNGLQFANGFVPTTVLSGTGNLFIVLDGVGLPFSAGLVTLAPGANIGSATIYGATGYGTGADDDVIKGFLDVRNVISGFDGNDSLRGGRLADTIDGGNGDDKLYGARGADILTGGTGADTFRYQSTLDSGLGANADHITDFVAGTDKFGFQLLDANPATPAIDPLTYVGSAAFAANGTAQIHWITSGANILVEADFDGDGIADMQIVLDNAGGQTLTSSDFLL